MTVVPFPTRQEPPELLLPIAAVTFGRSAHHQHPAAIGTTLCLLPIPDDARFGNPVGRSEIEPTDCEACVQAISYAHSLLSQHTVQPLDPGGLRSSAGAALAVAWTLDGIEVPA